MEYDIFISYSRADAPIVDQFVDKLTEAGYRIWSDHKIGGGDFFKTEIVRAIKSSASVIFFSSANSNASKWTVKEISYSLKKDKFIIPVKLDESEYAESIDFDLIDVNFIQYQPNCPSSAIEQLIKSISTHIGQPQPSKAQNNPDTNPYLDELNSSGESFYDIKNYQQAVYYFTLAADQGHPEAQFNLGVCYMNGRGVTRDLKEAVKWYLKAAVQGNAEAQFNLGACYDNGQGTPQNFKEAAKWYKKAADQGHAEAQNNLGSCYESGEGVPKDTQLAIEYYRKAAKQGNELAIENLKQLEERF